MLYARRSWADAYERVKFPTASRILSQFPDSNLIGISIDAIESSSFRVIRLTAELLFKVKSRRIERGENLRLFFQFKLICCWCCCRFFFFCNFLKEPKYWKCFGTYYLLTWIHRDDRLTVYHCYFSHPRRLYRRERWRSNEGPRMGRRYRSPARGPFSNRKQRCRRSTTPDLPPGPPRSPPDPPTHCNKTGNELILHLIVYHI